MAVVRMREAELQGFAWDQLITLRLAINVQLGSDDGEDITLLGAAYEEADGTRWRIYSDLKIRPTHAARLAVTAAKFPSIPEKWTDTIPFWIMEDSVAEWVEPDIVLPDLATMPEGADPYEWIVGEQTGVPGWVGVSAVVPSWLTPVTEE